MRWAVLTSDIGIFFPAAFTFVTVFYAGKKFEELAWALSVILLQPGHFQVHFVSDGLLKSVSLFYKDYFASVLFCFALNHKQMSAYYAPAFFAYLFGKSLQKKHPFLEVIKLGVIVIGTFAICWGPFLHSKAAALGVLSRLVPFQRGIFEDYVANFWCASSLLFKWKQIFSTSLLAGLALVATSLSLLPSVVQQIRAPSYCGFLFTHFNTSLSFYLFSYQVHAKSILLPLLPASLLILEDFMLNRGMIFCAMFSICSFPPGEAMAWYGKATLSLTKAFIRQSRLMGCLLNLAYMFVKPPPRFPFIFEACNSMLVFGCLILLGVLKSKAMVRSKNQTLADQVSSISIEESVNQKLQTPLETIVKDSFSDTSSNLSYFEMAVGKSKVNFELGTGGGVGTSGKTPDTKLLYLKYKFDNELGAKIYQDGMDRYCVKIEEQPSELRDLVPMVYSGDRYFNDLDMTYLVVHNSNIVDKWGMIGTKEKVDAKPKEAPLVLNKQNIKLRRINDMMRVNTDYTFMGLYKDLIAIKCILLQRSRSNQQPMQSCESNINSIISQGPTDLDSNISTEASVNQKINTPLETIVEDNYSDSSSKLSYLEMASSSSKVNFDLGPSHEGESSGRAPEHQLLFLKFQFVNELGAKIYKDGMERYCVKVEDRRDDMRDMVPVVYSGNRYFDDQGFMYIVVLNPSIVDKWGMIGTKEKIGVEPEEAPPALNKTNLKLQRVNDMTRVNIDNIFLGL
ncbi:hypothetical protein L7F22_031704 [Adiantum nelumboides]|nr:hypothetical protein [Adiantum nelumboides]